MAVSCDTYSSFIREVFFAELCMLHNASILFDLFSNGRYYVRYMQYPVRLIFKWKVFCMAELCRLHNGRIL